LKNKFYKKATKIFSLILSYSKKIKKLQGTRRIFPLPEKKLAKNQEIFSLISITLQSNNPIF
jgi:hypothetical protein